MAPRGRKKKGLMRDDAARDAMIEFGFEIRLINETIKELLELYNENAKSNPWKLIEEGGYAVLLDRLLEKQAEQEKQLAVHNEEVAVEEQAEPTQEEKEKSFVLKEQERHVEEGRDQIGSSSTALLGYGADTGKQTCQTDALSVTNAAVMDSTPAAFQSAEATADSVGVTNEAVMESSPAALQSAEATAGSVGGTKSSHCGWLSSEEESDSEEDGDDDDDEMIQLSPEPLCEELEDLLAEIRGDRKRKRPTRWDN